MISFRYDKRSDVKKKDMIKDLEILLFLFMLIFTLLLST